MRSSNVDVFTPDVSDEALERAAGLGPLGVMSGDACHTILSCNNYCVMVAVDNLKMLIQLTPNKKA